MFAAEKLVMKKWNYLSGWTSALVADQNQIIIPGGQLLDVSVSAPTDIGVWFRIAYKGHIYVPPGHTFEIGARELGACCGDIVLPQYTANGLLDYALIKSRNCDQFPGEMPITIEIGLPPPSGAGNDPRLPLPPEGGAPVAWFVAWEGGCP